MSSVNIVLILDQSASMSSYGYFDDAQLDASGFVSIMQPPDDSLAVLAISTNSVDVWPSPMALTKLSSDSVQDAAQKAIEAVTSSGLTNMRETLARAHSLLSSVAGSQAIIMLSDGEWNEGGDPLPDLPTNIPIWTIALGQHGQIQTLQQIANKTGGKAHLSPDQYCLYEIYCQIASETGVCQVAGSACHPLTTGSIKFQTATIPGGQSELKLAAAWTDINVGYTPQSPPPTGMINISAQDPNGNVYSGQPEFSHPGYVTFRIPNPTPGTWTLSSWYNGATSPFDCTLSLLEPASTLKLNLIAENYEVNQGEPLKITAHVTDDGKQLATVNMRSKVCRPLMSIEEAQAKYQTELAAITLPKTQFEDSIPEDKARLVQLRQQMLPDEDILPREHVLHQMIRHDDGTHHCHFQTEKKGIHNIHVQVEGYSSKRKSNFTRTGRISVNVV